MKTLQPVLLVAVAALMAAGTLAAQPSQPRPRTSPHETISTVIGERRTGNRITIVYGRPFTKDPRTGGVRKIWGGLVPWDKAWRLGADEATLLLTQQPLVIGGTRIPAGAYTLYLVPSETGSTQLAFSRKIGGWGAPIDETQDVARVGMERTTLEQAVDQLTLAIENNPAGGGVLRISWEQTQLSLSFTVGS